MRVSSHDPGGGERPNVLQYVPHLLVRQDVSLPVHGAVDDAMGDGHEELKVGFHLRLRRLEIRRRNDEDGGIGTIALSRLAVTAQAVLHIDRLPSVGIAGNVLRGDPGTQETYLPSASKI